MSMRENKDKGEERKGEKSEGGIEREGEKNMLVQLSLLCSDGQQAVCQDDFTSMFIHCFLLHRQ